MEILMIRHFQTKGNLDKRYIGKTDETLAETDHTKQLVQKRKKSCKNVERVSSSPMQRCLQTAALLFPGETPVLCDKLRECDFGAFEGKNYKELRDTTAYLEWMESGGAMAFPGGESRMEFEERCMEGFLKTVDAWIKEGVQKAALVVHGGTIMAVLSQLDSEGREFYDWQPENGGGYRIFLNEQEWKQGNRMCRRIEKL
ncbi:histidine phosphatase family protein [Muricomes intestini]|uniref:Alpha-ribazole phosphatase n=1 Tax=Muricomes intestini TaxID=1796634 RepID=A0A4R3K667_9FIRM|nr:histidine phosphatase family protein [Muricomes intestini]TCS78328.1 alpha-ribazole phosphatase [Muricomes intestini]HCR82090.1 histidine phosphatase family protein [Lachnospiraceae bacterium]